MDMDSIESTNFLQPSTVKRPAASFSTKNDSLCDNIFPIFQLNRILGQNIISMDCITVQGTLENSTEKICVFKQRFWSSGSILNIIFFPCFVYLTYWTYRNLVTQLGNIFQGTDLYTFSFEVIVIFIQTTLMFVFARINGKYLVQALNQMQKIDHTLKVKRGPVPVDDLNRLKSVKLLSWVLLIKSIITSLIYECIFLHMIFGLIVPYIQLRKGASNASFVLISSCNLTFIAEKMAYLLLPLNLQAFIGIFIILAVTVRELFVRITENIKKLIPISTDDEHQTNLKTLGNQICLEIEKYRLLFEETSKVVDLMSYYFGYGLLAVCTSTMLSVTSGVYTIILQETNLSTGEYDDDVEHIHKYFFVGRAFHLYFSLFSLLGIMISGQRITNAATLPAEYLRKISFLALDHQTKFQVSEFIKASERPVAISACKVTTIGTSFFAAAGTQMITYVVVLLQFRLSFTIVNGTHI